MMQIYLDIDGVMVPANSWRKPVILDDGFPDFTSNAIAALNVIISSLQSDIVLTTSHKHKYTLDEWRDIFTHRNIKVNKLSRLPKNVDHLNRKDELLQWFKNEPLEDRFMIIDDDKSLNALPEFLKDKLIQTSASVGLTNYLAMEAVNKFKNSSRKISTCRIRQYKDFYQKRDP
jgi:hypothetical protein